MSYLRPSGIDAAHHAWGIGSLLVKALRARWPKVKIVLRGRQWFLPLADAALVRTPRGGLYRGNRPESRLRKKAGALIEQALRDT